MLDSLPGHSIGVQQYRVRSGESYPFLLRSLEPFWQVKGHTPEVWSRGELGKSCVYSVEVFRIFHPRHDCPVMVAKTSQDLGQRTSLH